MDETQYISERLDKQIAWYSENSQINKQWFKRLKLAEIICAALIPFIAASSFNTIIAPSSFNTIFTGVLGIFIAISTAASTLCKFHENWIEYRATAEQLKHEKFLYLTNTEPYDDDQKKFQRFVQRVESLISKENSSWIASFKTNPPPTNPVSL